MAAVFITHRNPDVECKVLTVDFYDLVAKKAL
jgi:hypothetical protein